MRSSSNSAARRAGRRERGPGITRAATGMARVPGPAGGRQASRDRRPCCRWSSKPTTARRWRARFRGNTSRSSSNGHGAASPRSQLLVVGTAGRRALPDHRQDRTARSGRPTPSRGGRRRKPDSVAAPRGQFTLDEGTRPVVLVSAGIGVTPVLAILYALHDSRSTRDIWWLRGARNRRSLRRTGSLVLPHRCLPYLRNGPARGHGCLWFGTARAPGDGRSPGVLLSTSHRRRGRSLSDRLPHRPGESRPCPHETSSPPCGGRFDVVVEADGRQQSARPAFIDAEARLSR